MGELIGQRRIMGSADTDRVKGTRKKREWWHYVSRMSPSSSRSRLQTIHAYVDHPNGLHFSQIYIEKTA